MGMPASTRGRHAKASRTAILGTSPAPMEVGPGHHPWFWRAWVASTSLRDDPKCQTAPTSHSPLNFAEIAGGSHTTLRVVYETVLTP
jgi:hypothetical protein